MRRCRPWLGTLVEIECESAPAVEAGFAAIERIHHLMSAHEPESEVSRLNRSAPGAPVHLSPDTLAVLTRAGFWNAQSGGLFDPARAGFNAIARGALPLHAGQPQPHCGSDFLTLKIIGSFAWLDQPACLDLGGIAKGHAVDSAVAEMRAAGARTGVVNAGGDLFAFGRPKEVCIVDPATRAPAVSLLVEERALATSAGRRHGSGLDFGHLPARAGLASVSVEAARCIDSDALTKIAFAGHPGLARLLGIADARCLAIDERGGVIEPARAMVGA